MKWLKRGETPTRRSAAQKVLSTYELLEAILFWLRAPELRKTRFVCKRWNDVIKSSEALDYEWRKSLRDRIFVKRIRMMLFGDAGSGKITLRRRVSNIPFPVL